VSRCGALCVALWSPVCSRSGVSDHRGVALRRENTAPERRRLLRNLATVATLAGRLAYEDLGDALSGRSYYSVAVDSARETDDHQAAATALGYTAQLAQAEGMTAAALNHLTAALVHVEHAPTVASAREHPGHHLRRFR
jgi:hypothetical protein